MEDQILHLNIFEQPKSGFLLKALQGFSGNRVVRILLVAIVTSI